MPEKTTAEPTLAELRAECDRAQAAVYAALDVSNAAEHAYALARERSSYPTRG